jgi:hypothetical protein
MAPRGRRPEYDTEAERTAARRAQGAKRQQQFRARQRAKLEKVATTDTGASEAAPEDEEPHSPTTDDPTLERPVNDENPRESRTNLLYWATVLGGRTGQTPQKRVVNSIGNPSDVPASESRLSLPTEPRS